MNIAELKVDLVQLIMAIDDKKTLRKMMKACKKVAKKKIGGMMFRKLTENALKSRIKKVSTLTIGLTTKRLSKCRDNG